MFCEIASKALAGQGQYGVVSDLAREYGVSRLDVYEARDKGRTALEDVFAPDTTEGDDGEVLFELKVTRGDIKRSIIAAKAIGPYSHRDIVALVPIFYKGYRVSYGKTDQILGEAEERAADFSRKVNLSRIQNVALDEMFSQGWPVLSGIDIDTQYLFQLQKHESRSGDEWEGSLKKLRDEQGLVPKRVVKDAGTGLAKGVSGCWEDAAQNDDIFHAVRLLGQELYHLERRAYAAIREEYELEEKRGRKGTSYQLGQQLRRARARVAMLMERYDRFEALQREVQRVLDLSDPGSGVLHSSAEVVETLQRAADEMTTLGGHRIIKAAKYLRNRAKGLGQYLDDLDRRLKEKTPKAGGEEVVQAVVRLYQAGLNVGRKCPVWEKRVRDKEFLDAAEHLLRVTKANEKRIQRAFKMVLPILEQRYRASSCIENLNSALRPYLVVHKNVEQGFLNLYQFYWNTREREWGRGKGTSCYEQLTGKRVEDWLTLLGYPPSC
jgi:hypothetical protein